MQEQIQLRVGYAKQLRVKYSRQEQMQMLAPSTPSQTI
jgi:hypothetical protein